MKKLVIKMVVGLGLLFGINASAVDFTREYAMFKLVTQNAVCEEAGSNEANQIIKEVNSYKRPFIFMSS